MQQQRDQTPLKERARGRWHGILPALGVSPRHLRDKHGPCPICGGDHKADRFRFDNKEGSGSYFCSKCGAGEGIKLVMEVNGWDFKQAAAEIEKHLVSTKYVAPKPGMNSDEKRKALNEVWGNARPIRLGDPAAIYLTQRIGKITRFPSSLRHAEKVRYQDDTVSFHPAMLAMVKDIDGRPVNIHRTYLTEDGQKADVPSPRKMMAGDIPDGAAVRLWGHYEDELGIAEGIETAWAAARLYTMPVWSAINATTLSKWIPPKDVKRIVIFGDSDKSFTGQWATFALAKRLVSDKGGSYECEVRIPGMVIDPTVIDRDWDDILREKRLA